MWQAWNDLGLTVGDSAELLVTTNLADADVAARIADGEQVLRAGASTSVDDAVAVMREAVARGEWERSQTHVSLLPYLQEEVAEFIDAVHAGDAEELKQELADVLLQVLFHAELAQDFDFFDCAAAFVNKMRARAPYLFDGSTGVVPVDVQESAWEAGKIQ